ncbi:pre-peptidase C-terminal domain-containing protein [Usitatibacter palustris]|uniref:pre-peptidase C-terminal domain-containing protein n=1 Tax=Usitatibacter palustris TaxID=2732487 RepID=UPI001487E53E|nr:pre-peptidase C-terminal domain-containing protein [Usitatibacter palustris]
MAALTLVAANASAASSKVELIYDAAGNVKQFKRQAAYGLAITGFAPAQGPVGSTVTIYGAGFSATAINNTVMFNGVAATVSAADSGSLSVTVPSAATSGPISVSVGGLSASTTAPFTIITAVPPGYAPEDIITTVRLSPGGAPGLVEVGQPMKHAALLVDLLADTFYTLQFGSLANSPSDASIQYKVFKPDLTLLMQGFFGMSAARPTIHLPKTATAGVYFVMVSPGTAELSTMASVMADPILVVDGTSVAVSTTGPWQSTRSVFAASANQRLGLGISGFTILPYSAGGTTWRVYKPDGTELGITSCNAAGGGYSGNCDGEFLAPVAGTYTMIEETFFNVKPSFDMQLSNEVSGALVADVASNVVLSRRGQDGRYTFNVSAGDSFAVELSGVTPDQVTQAFNYSVLRPNGTQLTSSSASVDAPGYVELGTLSTAGTYTVVVDPAAGAYGSAHLSARQGTVLDTTSAPTAFSTLDAGENVRFRFTATAGQTGLTIGVAQLAHVGAGSSPSYLYVDKPDGSSVTSVSCYPSNPGGRCKVNLPALTVAGTYSVRLWPPTGIKISGNIALATEQTGTLVSGTPAAISVTRQGQNVRFSFAGTAGESTAIELADLVTSPSGQSITLQVYKPDGVLLTSTSTNTAGTLLNLPSLPVTGAYSLVVRDSQYGVGFSGRVTLDPGVALAIDGTMPTPTTVYAGETVRYTFAGTAGARVEFGLSGLTYASASSSTTWISVLKPDGSTQTSMSCSPAPSACEVIVASLPITGTYVVTVAPPGTSLITGGSLALSTPHVAALNINGASETANLARPGQTARFTFAGSASQLLRLNWTSATVVGGGSVLVSVLKPDGSTLTSVSYSNGATGGIDVPSLPTTGTYTVVVDPPAASTTSVPLTLVTR